MWRETPYPTEEGDPTYRGQPTHFAGPLVAWLDQELVFSCRIVEAGREFRGVIKVCHRGQAVAGGPGQDAGFTHLPAEEMFRGQQSGGESRRGS